MFSLCPGLAIMNNFVKIIILKNILGTLLLGMFIKENVLDHSICTNADADSFPKSLYHFILHHIPVDACFSHHLELSFENFYHFNLHFPDD